MFLTSEIFAFLAIFVAIMRYATYLRAIYLQQARPHVFTWFNIGLIVSIAAYAQVSLNGGPSTWVLIFIAATCFFIAALALFVGEKNITKSDWFAFCGALLAIPVWIYTEDPVWGIVVIIIIDFLSFYPTIRKSWHDPWGEPPISYFWGGLRYFLTLFAVAPFAIETLAYPFFLMVTEWGFALYVLYRRRILTKKLKE